MIDKRQDNSDEDLKIISVRFVSGVVDKSLFFEKEVLVSEFKP